MLNIGLAELACLSSFCLIGVAGLAAVGTAVFAAQRGRPAACPLCSAPIRRGSRVCTHCKRDLPAGWSR